MNEMSWDAVRIAECSSEFAHQLAQQIDSAYVSAKGLDWSAIGEVALFLLVAGIIVAVVQRLVDAREHLLQAARPVRSGSQGLEQAIRDVPCGPPQQPNPTEKRRPSVRPLPLP
jgi:hypothetical protein